MTLEPSTFRASALPANSYLTRSVYASSGMILVEGSGMWSAKCAASHFQELRILVDAARRQRGAARVLIDLGGALVQASTTSNFIERQAESLYQENDWVALVISSRLLAMQMRRVGGRATYRHFDRSSDAMAWLLSDPDQAGGPIPYSSRSMQAGTTPR